MKKLLIIAGLLVTTSAVLAQGSMVFANLASGVMAPVSAASGAKIVAGVTPGTYVADLWWSSDTTGGTALVAAGFNTPFSSNTGGGGGGWFLGGTKTLPVGGIPILAQVAVWETMSGTADFAGAVESGMSTPFVFTLTLPPATPAPMVGLTSFQLEIIPEPASFALAGLGAAMLLIFRRRK